MKFIQRFIKNFILRMDLFAAQPTFRFNGGGSYETVYGGCLSLLMMIGFAVIFYQSFYEVLNKVNISSSLNIEDNPYQQSEIEDIKFAVGIKGFYAIQLQKYFDVILKRVITPRGGMPVQTYITLSSCNKSDWENKGDRFGKLFQVYGMDNLLCPSEAESMYLKGFQGSDQWITMTLLIQSCNTTLKPSCYPPPTVRNMFSTLLPRLDFLKVDFLVLNTVISPQQEDPTKSVIENEIFITFSNTSGSRSQIKLGRYEITTDNSIWPFQQQSVQEGYYLTSHNTYTINLYSRHFVRIQIEKARTIYQITRAHDKIDEMLSYVGGLFSLLFAAIFFFVGSFNEYRYEIAVAEHTFCLDGTGRKIKENNFGFGTYLKYSLYDWIKTLGIPCNWTSMKQIDEAREQATEQMDVRYLTKKIQRYEIIFKFLIGQHNLIMANLSKPPTLQNAKKMRKIAEYYDKVIKVENAQKILDNISLGDIDQNTTGQIKKDNDTEIEVELDSEDEQVQQQILEIYKQIKQGQNDGLTAQILKEIPQSMKDRLAKVQSNRKQKQDIMKKQKLQVESLFSIKQTKSPPAFQSNFSRIWPQANL